MRFGRSPSGILACFPLGEGLCMLGGLCIVQSLLAYKPGIRAGLIIGGCRPCDQARMLDSVRTEVLHDAKPTNERKLALGLRPKPHFIFTKRFIDSLIRRMALHTANYYITNPITPHP